MTTDKRGISTLLLQRQLALPRYETAWMMLHKFRRAMVNLAREPLQGEVEVMIPGLEVLKPACEEAGNSKAGRRHSSWWLWRNAAVQPAALAWR
jgi:hypothetical protein